MPTSTYTVQTVAADGTTTDVDTKSKKSSAVSLAMQTAKDTGSATQVVTSTGTVVESFSAPGNRAKPRTRVESAEFELGEGVTLPEGYEIAYSRGRINTLVLRNATEKLDYLVFNTQSGDAVPAKGTRDACSITTRMAQEAKARKAAERDAAKEAKAAAKAAKAEEPAAV